MRQRRRGFDVQMIKISRGDSLMNRSRYAKELNQEFKGKKTFRSK